MNIYYLLSISQLTKLRIYPFISGGLLVMGLLNLFFHYFFLHTQIKKIYAMIAICAVVVGTITLYASGGPTLLKLILFALAIKDVKEEDVLRYMMISLSLGVIVVGMSSVFGITDILYSGGKQAYTFGFGNPNNLPMILVGIISIVNILNIQKLSLKLIALEIVGTIYVFYLCKSRTALGVLLISYALLFINRYLKNKEVIIKRIMIIGQYIFLINAGISLYIAKAYQRNEGIWSKIDLILSWRPYLWNKYFRAYSVGILGMQIDSNMGALDNAYLTLLLKYGVIVFVLYALIFVTLSKYAVKEKRWELVIYIITYEIYFMFEFGVILINVNSVLMVFVTLFMNNYFKHQDVEKNMEI